MATAVAGAIAGAANRFATAPLDVLKIRFQVQLEPIVAARGAAAPSKYTSLGQALTTIVREEGLRGLWRGSVPGQLLTMPYTAAQFVALHQSRALVAQCGLDRAPGLSYVTGAIAGIAGTIASYPFDVLRTTLAAQGVPKVYSGMTDAAVGLLRDHGPQGLFRGMGIAVLEIIPYAAIQFGTYDYFNRRCDALRRRWGRAGVAPRWGPGDLELQHLLCGLVAGLLAKVATHPLDVVKKRAQIVGLARSRAYGARIRQDAPRRLYGGLRDIYVHEGIGGLYKGLGPSVLKAGPSAAITFVVYEMVLKWLTARDRVERDLDDSGSPTSS